MPTARQLATISAGARLDECLHVVRELATGEKVTFQGTHIHVTDAQILPVLQPPVPLPVGGRSAATARRAARRRMAGDLGVAEPVRRRRRGDRVHRSRRRAGRRSVAARDAGLVLVSVSPILPEAVSPARWSGSTGRRSTSSPATAPPAHSPTSPSSSVPYVDAECRSFNLLTVGPEAATVDGGAEVHELLQG